MMFARLVLIYELLTADGSLYLHCAPNVSQDYVEEHNLPWTPALRYSWLGFKRPGDYYVPVIKLRVEKPMDFAVKLPTDPKQLGLVNPYPALQDSWDEHSKEWSWAIVSVDLVPDVGLAVDISRKFQPERGPMRIPEGSAPQDAGDASGDGASSAV
jgi:hypothetical protein